MKCLLGFCGGLVVGAAIALLTAPEKGEVMRHKIKRAFEDKMDDLKEDLRKIKKDAFSEIEI